MCISNNLIECFEFYVRYRSLESIQAAGPWNEVCLDPDSNLE